MYDLDNGLLILIGSAATMMVAGCVQNILGFGYAIVAMCSLPWMMGVRESSTLVAVCSILPLAYGAWQCRHDLSLKSVGSSVLGALVGLPLGLLVFQFADPSLLLRLTGGMILLVVAAGFYQDWCLARQAALAVDADGVSIEIAAKQASGETVSGLAIAGLMSGVLAGAIGIGGPPIAAYATNRRWSVGVTRGFLLTFSFTVASLRCTGLAVTGWVGSDILLLCSLAIPCSVLGGVIGVQIAGWLHPVLFRRLTLSALSVLSIGLIL